VTNAAFYFAEEAYSVSGAKLVGRQAAGHGFLRAFAQHADVEALWGYSPGRNGVEAFEKFVRPLRPSHPVHGATAPTMERLRDVGCVYFPGPDLAPQAWQREFFGSASWSLCGVNHTLSTKRVMSGITDLLLAPVEPWDAVVCTSASSRDVITRLLGAQSEWLAGRFGAKQPRMPKLPVIPLGVDCSAYEFSAADRARARQELAIGEDDIVVLYLGRLSFRAKVHPFAMYSALATAAAGRRVVLIEAGQFANDRAEEAFAEARAALCPDLGYRAVDGLNATAKRSAWAAADVFCSLADNIQETFGLTPIEAMAAGLPAIVSDWDGYRDTVRDGIDGYRIPTLMPIAGAGMPLALRHSLDIDDYNQHLGLVSQFTAVDIEAAVRAFQILFANPELRHKMGASGQQRAREVFDWRRVVAQYQALWAELAQERVRHAGTVPRRWPGGMDPFALFGSYPTTQLGPDTAIERGSLHAQDFVRLRNLAMFSFATPALPPDETIERILGQVLAHGPVRVRSILATFPPNEHAWMVCTLVWLAKVGAVRIASR
jgi:alpha-maltose-1-phosphate synthase